MEYTINMTRIKNHQKAVEGSAYTCTFTWRQPGLSGGCIDFFVIRTHPTTHISVYRGSAIPKYDI